ncbi:MAG TPA: hypothetical protein VIO60_04065 [Rectinemataceae bacterium]
MKKLIVLLLALAMVGAVSAQVMTAVGLYGEVTLVDQAGNGQFIQWGNGYDTLTFKAQDKDGKYGFSFTDQNLLDGNFDTIRDWTVWGKIPVLKGKLSVGKLRNGTFRLTLPYWAGATVFGGTDRISGQSVLFESDAKNGLVFGVALPYSLTAGPALDTLKNVDLGVKYDMKDVGTGFVMANLDLDAAPGSVINAGFKYVGMKALTATLIGQAGLNNSTYKVGFGAAYTGVEKLAANLEAALTSTAGVLAWSVWARGAYDVSDPVTVAVAANYGSAGYDVNAAVTYDLGAGFSAEVAAGFNSAFYAAATLYYGVSL